MRGRQSSNMVSLLRSRLGMSLIIIGLLLLAATGAVFASDQDFALILFPDTQYLVSGRTSLWNNMCKWVVDNREALDVRAVLSEGDITDTARAEHFKVALDGFTAIEGGGIPCVPIVGNHDYDLIPARREVTRFDAVFGPCYFTSKPWYGGNLNGSDANYYVKLTIGRREFLVVALELFPRTEAVEWASGVIDSNRGAEVIVLTHGYLNYDGTRSQHADAYGPDSYALTNSNSGEDLWNNLISKKPNIRAVVCGHQISGPNVAVTQALGDKGNIVQQIFINYQYATGAWVGILSFHTSRNNVDLAIYNTDSDSGQGFDPKWPTRTLDWKPTTTPNE